MTQLPILVHPLHCYRWVGVEVLIGQTAKVSARVDYRQTDLAGGPSYETVGTYSTRNQAGDVALELRKQIRAARRLMGLDVGHLAP